jgi:hypothetical protein
MMKSALQRVECGFRHRRSRSLTGRYTNSHISTHRQDSELFILVAGKLAAAVDTAFAAAQIQLPFFNLSRSYTLHAGRHEECSLAIYLCESPFLNKPPGKARCR